MLPISILEKTHTSIVYELPPGKPDPKIECKENSETRERVLQSAYKSNTCWYYALNFLRKRIGKKPPESLRAAREIEKACSLRRKEHTKHEDSLPAVANQLGTEVGLKTLQSITLEKAQFYIANESIVRPMIETPESLEGCPSLFPFFKEFVGEKKHSDMHAFLLEKKFSQCNELNTTGQPQEISPTLMQPHHPLKEPSLDNARHMQL